MNGVVNYIKKEKKHVIIYLPYLLAGKLTSKKLASNLLE